MNTGTIIAIIVLVLIAILSVIFVFLDKVQFIYYGLTKNLHVKRLIKKYVNKRDFLLLPHLCLRIAPQQYLDIDYVLMGDRFIYVIAAKFYYGFLSGKDIDYKWVLADGKNTDIIDNPLLANETRVDYLARILNVNPNILVNVVLVSRTTTIDSLEIHNSSLHLIEEKNFERFIDTFENDKDYPIFAAKDLEQLAADLYDYHNSSVEDKRMNSGKWNH